MSRGTTCAKLRRDVELTAEGAKRCRDPSSELPEGDGDEPSGCSNVTGPGIRTEGVVSNVGLGNEMRTISEHDWWRKRDARRIRQLELLFFPEAAGVAVASS